MHWYNTMHFGRQTIWEDVTLSIPQGEVSVMLGPSGTGKSVFLKSLIGLLRPERGKIIVDGTNIIECSAKELYEIRTLFGVMFQDGALFGSMSLFDNTAFPLREHTKKKESEIRNIVMEKLDLHNTAAIVRLSDRLRAPNDCPVPTKSPPTRNFSRTRTAPVCAFRRRSARSTC